MLPVQRSLITGVPNGDTQMPSSLAGDGLDEVVLVLAGELLERLALGLQTSAPSQPSVRHTSGMRRVAKRPVSMNRAKIWSRWLIHAGRSQRAIDNWVTCRSFLPGP